MKFENLLEESLLLEDTPENYIISLMKKVMSTAVTNQQNNRLVPYTEFNRKRKSIDPVRAAKGGGELTPDEFVNQGIAYFDKNYPNQRRLRTIILDALRDYVN